MKIATVLAVGGLVVVGSRFWGHRQRSCVGRSIIIIIIIIINDNVYGAVIVTMVTARVHPVHLMNAD